MHSLTGLPSTSGSSYHCFCMCLPAAASRLLKQSPQPDVVSTSIADEHASSEVSRLEALCGSMSIHLSTVSAALSERTRWFEAMTIIVQYFAEQVHGAFLLAMTLIVSDSLDTLWHCCLLRLCSSNRWGWRHYVFGLCMHPYV